MVRSPWQIRDVTEDYESGRPEYPPGLAGLLAREVGLTRRSTVVDLAAGTGKLTRVLLPLVERVIAIDPAERMLSALRSASPAVTVVAGRAEAIPLRDGSVDAVLVGNAFHWMRGNEAVSEMTRVVRPGAPVVVVWNVPRFDLCDPHIDELLAALASYRTPGPSGADFASRRWLDPFEKSPRVGPLEHRELPFEHHWTRRGLRAYIGSWSTLATLSDQERTDVLATVTGILGRVREPIVGHFVCEAHWTFSVRST